MKVEEFVTVVRARGQKGVENLRNSLRRADAAAMAFAKVAAAVAGATAGMGLAAAKAADEIAKGARRSGLSGEEYEALSTVFERGSSSAAGLEDAAKRLARAQVDAASGAGRAAEMFERLGISTRGADFSQRSLSSLLPEVLRRLGETSTESERLAAAQHLLGGSAANLSSLMSMSGDEMQATIERSRVLGFSFSGVRDDAEALNDAIDDTFLAFRSMAYRAVAPMIPIMADAATAFVRMLERIKPIVDLRIDRIFGGIAQALRDLNPHLKALGVALVSLGGGVMLARLTTGMSGLLSTIGGPKVAAAISGMAGLAKPLALLALALLAIDDAAGFIAGDDSLMGRIIEALGGEGASEKVRSMLTEAAGAVSDMATALGAVGSTAASAAMERLTSFMSAMADRARTRFPALAEWIDGVADSIRNFKVDLGILSRIEQVTRSLQDARSGWQQLGAAMSSGDPEQQQVGMRALGGATMDSLRELGLGARDAFFGSNPQFGVPSFAQPTINQSVTVNAPGATPEQAGRIAREVARRDAVDALSSAGLPAGGR